MFWYAIKNCKTIRDNTNVYTCTLAMLPIIHNWNSLMILQISRSFWSTDWNIESVILLIDFSCDFFLNRCLYKSVSVVEKLGCNHLISILNKCFDWEGWYWNWLFKVVFRDKLILVFVFLLGGGFGALAYLTFLGRLILNTLEYKPPPRDIYLMKYFVSFGIFWGIFAKVLHLFKIGY